LLSLSSYSQCDNPPTRTGNSTIVSSSNGDILINGVPCNQLGNSSNYNCDTINLNTTLTVEDGECVWTIINGNWNNPVLQHPLAVTLLYFIGYSINNNLILEWKTEVEINSCCYLIQGSYNMDDFDDLQTVQSGMYIYIIELSHHEYDYYRLIEIDINNKNTILSTIWIKSFYMPLPHVSQGMYIIRSNNTTKKIIIL
jgi:hypothetical protein